MKKLFLVLTAFALVFSPMITQAETGEFTEEGLESLLFSEVPVVSSVGFFDMDAKKAPGYTYIIGNSMIENTTIRSLNDMIEQLIPGVEKTLHDHVACMVFRGPHQENEKPYFMLDGQSMNFRGHNGTGLWQQVPFLGYIDRVEVVQGPSAIVHGAGAITGIVNVIPKTGTKYPGLHLSAEYGTAEELIKTEIEYGKEYGLNKDLFLYFGFVTSQGFDPRRKRSDWMNWLDDAIANGETELSMQAFKGRPTFEFNSFWNHDDFKLNVHSFQRFHSMGIDHNKMDINGRFEGGIMTKPQYRKNITDTEDITLSGDIGFRDNGWYIVDDNSRNYSRDDNYFDGAIGTQGNIVQLWSEAQMLYKAVVRSNRFDKHNFAFGGKFGRRYFDSGSKGFFYNSCDPTPGDARSGAWYEYSIFTEDVISVTDKLTASLGARWDKVRYGNMGGYGVTESHEDRISPRLAAAYEINDNQNIKLSYQEGFRWPNAIETQGNTQSNAEGGIYTSWNGITWPVPPTLGPEVVESFELNYGHNIPKLKLNMDLNIFYNTLIDFSGWTSTYFTWANCEDRFTYAGGELIYSWDIRDNLQLTGSYGYSRPLDFSMAMYNLKPLTDEERDEWYMYSPHQIKATLKSINLNGKLISSLNLNYYSAVDVDNEDYEYSHVYSNSRLVWNVSGKYNFTDKSYVKLSCLNIFQNEIPYKDTLDAGTMNRCMDWDSNQRRFYLEAGFEF